MKNELQILRLLSPLFPHIYPRNEWGALKVRSLLEGSGDAPRIDTAKTPRSSIKANGQDTVEKDRMIAQLRARNDELERECELLRGRLYLAMQNRA